jgi:hypothetical protein
MQAAEKKRSKEEKDIIHRLRPFSRLQTADDFESFSTDILCKMMMIVHYGICFANYARIDEAMLRKRIQELQHYRRMGLSTVADINKYEADLTKRVRYHLSISTRVCILNPIIFRRHKYARTPSPGTITHPTGVIYVQAVGATQLAPSHGEQRLSPATQMEERVMNQSQALEQVVHPPEQVHRGAKCVRILSSFHCDSILINPAR